MTYRLMMPSLMQLSTTRSHDPLRLTSGTANSWLYLSLVCSFKSALTVACMGAIYL